MTARVMLSARECGPADRDALLRRAWVPAERGPSVVSVRDDDLVDLTRAYPTVSQLLNTSKPADIRAAIAAAPRLAPVDAVIANSVEGLRENLARRGVLGR